MGFPLFFNFALFKNKKNSQGDPLMAETHLLIHVYFNSINSDHNRHQGVYHLRETTLSSYR